MSAPRSRLDVMLVGSSFHFMSGLSVYTCRLANALAADRRVGVLLLDRLIPVRLYPGGARVGKELTSIDYDPAVQIEARIDWWWGLGMVRALRALHHDKPRLLVLQWWTAATLHTYLLLALAARRLDVPVVIEFHEVQDTGEARVPLVGSYARLLVPRLIALASGALVHHEHDREALRAAYGDEVLAHLSVEVAPHGPYDHLSHVTDPAAIAPTEDNGVTRLLFFGTIRPYKGLEDLVTVFNRLPPEQAATFTLTIVGETWEGWTKPAELIEASPHRNRITFVNHYVTDEQAASYLAAADVMVLPARRGSASGPLQIAMSAGLNIVMYAVGGLVDAVKEYNGAVLVPAADLDALQQALLDMRQTRAQRWPDPHSWDQTAAAFDRLQHSLDLRNSTG